MRNILVFTVIVPYSQILRHLYNDHAGEVEVARLIATKDAKLKLALLTEIRNLASLHVPCPHCKAWCRREQLWRHADRCILGSGKTKSKFGNPVKTADMLVSNAKNEVVTKVLRSKRKDAVYFANENDEMVH